MKPAKTLLSIFLVLAAAFACSKSSSRGAAKVEEISLPGGFADCLMADFDGDSITEILALTAAEPATGNGAETAGIRKGAIFSRVGAYYGSDQATVFELPPDAIVFDTGDIDGDARPEVLYLTGEGLYAMDYSAGIISQPRRVISQNTLFALPTPASVSYWDFYRQAENRSYILIPCFKGITIYSVTSAGQMDSLGTAVLSHQARALLSQVTEMRELNPLNYICTLPTIQIDDNDGDGVDDIFVISNGRLAVYSGRLDGGFEPEAGVVFRVSQNSEAQPGDPTDELQYQVSDLNGDRRADIVVTRASGGVTRFESEISVYFCRARGGYDDEPSYRQQVKKSAGIAYLNDFNGDGRTDLVIPALELGIIPMLKMLILNRLDMNIDIYMQEGAGRFPVEPSLRKQVTTAIDLNTGSITYGNNMAFGGDFNGDHLTDFLLNNGKGELRIFFGAPGQVLSPEIGWSFELPNPSSILTYDLDNDGRHEILAFYGQNSPDHNKIRLVWVNASQNR